MNRIDLEGRRAAVTGAAQGIGLAVAERLMQSGAAVALWDRDAGELRTAGDRLRAGGG
ncbi:MAG TPA: SDR family NAD(P)-dependent oxidoreductase, partial [Geminicoccaceae bacterium]